MHGHTLAGDGFWMEEADRTHGQSARHDSLPWFLYDMRPQGFLGRGFVQGHPALQLPTNLAHWNDDQILKALVNAGEDVPGNLIVGTLAFDRYHALPKVGRSGVSDAASAYPALALQALAQTAVGSSAVDDSYTANTEPHVTLLFWTGSMACQTTAYGRFATDLTTVILCESAFRAVRPAASMTTES